MGTADLIALWSLIAAVAAVLLATVSVIVAIYAIFKGNRNASVATMVTLYEASRAAWERFLKAENDEQRFYELAELMNLLEIGSSILNEKSFVGVSKDLLREYIKEAIAHLRNDKRASDAIEKMFSAPTTFEHIRKFYNEAKGQPLSLAPKQWFQM